MARAMPARFLHTAAQLRWQVVLEAAETDQLELDLGHDVDRRLLEGRVLTEWQRHVVGKRERLEKGRTLKRHTHLLAQARFARLRTLR